MRRIVSLLLGSVVSIGSLHAQTWKMNRTEIFVGLPVNHYFGDIGNSPNTNPITSIKDFRFKVLRTGIGGGVSYKVNPLLAGQVSLNVGFLSNTDKGSYYNSRGYQFSTFFSEVAIKGLYYIIPESHQNYYYSIMDLRGGVKHLNKPFSLYIFAGVGGLFFNTSPNSKLSNRGAPEVNDNKYFSLVIPAGIGGKFEFYPRLQLGIEVGARYVTTDYLDAFSSAFSRHNDMYYTINFNVYYKIPYQKLLKRSFWKF